MYYTRHLKIHFNYYKQMFEQTNPAAGHNPA